jgi:fructokinase
MIYAAVEGGGQSWVCALAEGTPENIIEIETFPTTTPDETLHAIRAWLGSRRFDSIGIATFGPIDARPHSPTFGFITSTPKLGWTNTDVLRQLGIYDEFKSIPYKFDTDVNAPALSEHQPEQSSCAYITVGTGIGVGLVINGKSVHGALHPEAGHMTIGIQEGDVFPGVCRFHGKCVEGMCSSVAVAARAQVNLTDLPHLSDTHQVWDVCAYYIASLCVNLILTVSPERIVLGGGLMNREILYTKIRQHVLKLLNHYIVLDILTEDNISDFIVASKYKNRAGIVGALFLSKLALDSK